ncbi:hypothetical protein Nepgr_022779 [Nepenthes gracilis]|uniref:Uncharacterized protein n=1 Tax=Nepenthes gracilis TaxID=150966 RepID=A0AAD3XX45_NEPGR|nr:hypothetical protein Nepgr_022779 [Nepenthes gracilis]
MEMLNFLSNFESLRGASSMGVFWLSPEGVMLILEKLELYYSGQLPFCPGLKLDPECVDCVALQDTLARCPMLCCEAERLCCPVENHFRSGVVACSKRLWLLDAADADGCWFGVQSLNEVDGATVAVGAICWCAQVLGVNFDAYWLCDLVLLGSSSASCKMLNLDPAVAISSAALEPWTKGFLNFAFQQSKKECMDFPLRGVDLGLPYWSLMQFFYFGCDGGAVFVAQCCISKDADAGHLYELFLTCRKGCLAQDLEMFLDATISIAEWTVAVYCDCKLEFATCIKWRWILLALHPLLPGAVADPVSDMLVAGFIMLHCRSLLRCLAGA